MAGLRIGNVNEQTKANRLRRRTVENDNRERTSTEAFCVRSARLKSKTGNNVANSYRALLHYDILHVEICQPDRRNDVLRWRKVVLGNVVYCSILSDCLRRRQDGSFL